MVTLKEIAERSNVNVSTVSAALNDVYGSKGISAKKREKIKQIAKEMGYVVDDMARSLRTGKDKVIGYVSSNLASDPLLQFVSKEINKHDYFIKLFESGDKLVSSCLRQRVSGVIFHDSSPITSVHISGLAKNSIQVAAVNSVDTHNECINVCSDYEKGIHEILQYLYDLGHRQICFVGCPESGMAPAERYRAYNDFMKSSKLRGSIIKIESDAYYDSEKAFDLFFKTQRPAPTAYFCWSSGIVSLLYSFFSRHGMRIPDDVSVAGFGQNSFFSFLTHVDEQYKKIGTQIVKLLIKSVENNKHSSIQNIFPTKLITGNTVKNINHNEKSN